MAPNAYSSVTSERSSLHNKIDGIPPALPRRTCAEISPPFQVSNQPTPTERHPREGFDILSLIRDLPRKSSNSVPQFPSRKVDESISRMIAPEPSHLLVAKAEKLTQDEELEVIRIDTPYSVSQQHTERNPVTGQSSHNSDFNLPLSKDRDAESPSSKSEIFWYECSEGEEDFEVQAINESVRPLKVEMNGHDKENSIMLSFQSSKTEEEKKIIREKIEKLREIAKGRTREERFTALTRQKELKR